MTFGLAFLIIGLCALGIYSRGFRRGLAKLAIGLAAFAVLAVLLIVFSLYEDEKRIEALQKASAPNWERWEEAPEPPIRLKVIP